LPGFGLFGVRFVAAGVELLGVFALFSFAVGGLLVEERGELGVGGGDRGVARGGELGEAFGMFGFETGLFGGVGGLGFGRLRC
jgi:hypothetical protein